MLERAAGAVVNFWLIFVGFNVTFFPMHILGLLGMPRRVYTYPSDLGWGTLNLIATIGAYVLAVGLVVFVVNVVRSLRWRRAGRRRPVGRRHARMGDVLAAAAVQLRGDPGRPQRGPALGPAAREPRRNVTRRRRAPDRWTTSLLDGRSRARAANAGRIARGRCCSLLALALVFVGLIIQVWLASSIVGAVLVALALGALALAASARGAVSGMSDRRAPRAPPLAREPAWWGMLLFIATEAALFALLLASYFYVRVPDRRALAARRHRRPRCS